MNVAARINLSEARSRQTCIYLYLICDYTELNSDSARDPFFVNISFKRLKLLLGKWQTCCISPEESAVHRIHVQYIFHLHVRAQAGQDSCTTVCGPAEEGLLSRDNGRYHRFVNLQKKHVFYKGNVDLILDDSSYFECRVRFK